MLKPSLEDFEHNFTSTGDDCNCSVAWTVFNIALLPVLTPMLAFPNFMTYWMEPLLASSFRILNSFAGIPSPPIALLAAVLLKTHLTSHSRMSGSEWETTPLWLSGSLSFLFVYFLCVLFQFLLGLFCCIKSQNTKESKWSWERRTKFETMVADFKLY